MKASIEVTQLEKIRDDFHLGPININIEPGIVTALVGNNGAGKSTLIKTIMNLVKPSSGDIRILGSYVEETQDWQKEIAYLPQNKLGYDPFNGNQLKELIASLYPNWDDKLFNRMVKELDVNLRKNFKSLSPGMQQKLLLSLTIPRNTPILILDEPTSHIDIVSKSILLDLLAEWMEHDDRTLILATHQVEDIRKLADMVAIMKDGDLLAHTDKDSLTQSYTQYWMVDPLPSDSLPGEVKRKGSKSIVTENEVQLEQYLSQHQLNWLNKEQLSLEDTISLMLTI
ncbi:ABC transporter ATP-binding protein [Piscibacillus halophilus]|uniref:ABC-2 type transport system ATP-binding protein n=1 Tax=Piscibacillus halophilus TaxID=571933 RepID=A0A1H9CH12_9BACI|nr:ABC transporter ATP-binding protein [Piscibacillus halophilus]SEQ00459.1 ABC-2 type transport system ATP-binding protein [Piscibacillus halophilus]